MHWYLEGWRKFAVFHGRARRKEYWFFFLFNFLIAFVLGFIDGVAGTFNPEIGIGVLGGLYSLAVLIPSISIAVRRLHDIDKRGWWIFILLIPLLGVIIFLLFMIRDSTPGENRFGPNPKGAEA